MEGPGFLGIIVMVVGWSSEKSWGQFEGASRRRTHFPVNTVKEALGRHRRDVSISSTTDFPKFTEFLINDPAI